MIIRTWKDIDKYSSYMSIGVHSADYNQKICNGKFAEFLKTNFDLQKLPYDMKLLDLLVASPSSYELYVKLPEEFFKSWKNYPSLGDNFDDMNEDLNSVFYFDLVLLSTDSFEIKDLVHPYDSNLKQSFVEKYKQTNQIDSVEKVEHENGRFFYPCEMYLAHWRAYVLVETIVECKFIEKYKTAVDGKKNFLEKFIKINEEWTRKYKSTLDIVSTYKTVSARLGDENSDVNFHKDLLDFLNIDIQDIETTIENLLIIYKKFSGINKSKKITDFDNALNLLQQDIYLMVEWLEYLGVQRANIHKKWSYEKFSNENWVELSEVLPRMEIVDNSTLVKFSQYYLDPLVFKWMESNHFEIENLINDLSALETSKVWIRTFSRLHKEIQTNKRLINFDFPLIIDSLLVLTIRTESILRERLEELCGGNENLINDVVNKLGEFAKGQDKRVFNNVKSLQDENKRLTKLEERPENIFKKIQEVRMPNGLSGSRESFIRNILMFIIARNYFAHHSYKDSEIGYVQSILAKQIIVACFTTIIFTMGATKNQQ
ncbi:hypothetical protein [Acinetobacter sp. SA01]|uniref:hypothetical protein n=1 Tax=Acinetobacter sp. SA01 TaxID=1862567 RepID=UPI00140D7381|nr:hypothetical protein [Acinetobacter sp. SA01]